jgi:AcrR family transcriptional regulator
MARSEETAGIAPRQNLNAEDWARAALEAMAAGGLEAVAVEPLARTLGVTKGSFYWHFPNRDALVQRALELWEREETEDIIQRVDRESDAYARIVKLFKAANSGYRSGRLYLALVAASERPDVNAAVRRVAQRRLSYLHACYRALGMSQAEARRWSTFAYATFMGNLQLRRDVPDAVPAGPQFNEYLKLMIRTLVPRVRAEETVHPRLVSLPRTGTTDAG